MNKINTSKTFVAKPWVKYAVCDVIVYAETYPELTNAEQRVLDAFKEHKKCKGKYPSTAQVAKSLSLSNQTWVHELLMKLVGGGYIACYLKSSKRHWTDRETGLRMQEALIQSAQNVAYR